MYPEASVQRSASSSVSLESEERDREIETDRETQTYPEGFVNHTEEFGIYANGEQLKTFKQERKIIILAI